VLVFLFPCCQRGSDMQRHEAVWYGRILFCCNALTAMGPPLLPTSQAAFIIRPPPCPELTSVSVTSNTLQHSTVLQLGAEVRLRAVWPVTALREHKGNYTQVSALWAGRLVRREAGPMGWQIGAATAIFLGHYAPDWPFFCAGGACAAYSGRTGPV
jgi:hypothetical protein